MQQTKPDKRRQAPDSRVGEPVRLTSWKDIAAYLGRDVRTVMRWEKERQLPVHRGPGARGIVFADPAELDAWMRGPASVPPPAPVEPPASRNRHRHLVFGG